MILRGQHPPPHRKTPHRTISISPQHHRPAWHAQNLLSMRRIEPYLYAFHHRLHRAKHPATGVLAHHAPQGHSNRLMPKARAKQRLSPLHDLPDQPKQPPHPSIRIMHRGRASGDDPTVKSQPLCRKIPVLHRKSTHPPTGSQPLQQCRELRAILRMCLRKITLVGVRHQHRNMHNLSLYIFMNMYSIFIN